MIAAPLTPADAAAHLHRAGVIPSDVVSDEAMARVMVELGGREQPPMRLGRWPHDDYDGVRLALARLADEADPLERTATAGRRLALMGAIHTRLAAQGRGRSIPEPRSAS